MADDKSGDDLATRLLNANEEITRLKERQRELIADLMRKSAEFSDVDDQLRRWRTELEIVAGKGGHNLCHIWIPDLLKRTIGHTGNFPDPEKMTKAEFRLGCRFYQDDIFGPDKASIYSGQMFGRRAVFLDRDGTLIEAIHRPGFVKKITAPFSEKEIVFSADVHMALDMLKQAGFLRIMVTNQPDVANGYLDEAEWQKIQKRVQDTLALDDVFMCRHTTQDDCPFKKPSSMMLQSASDKWGIDLSRSFMVGDTDVDMKAGRGAGCGTILVNRFYNTGLSGSDYDIRADNLMVVAKAILGI